MIKKDVDEKEVNKDCNLNISLDTTLMKKAKAKAALLGISLREYIARLIEDNVENIFLERDIKTGGKDVARR